MNGKTLVAYFSASGVTAKTAKMLADTAQADLYEIKPSIPYTATDLDWNDKKSRSTREMNDPAACPEIGGEPSSVRDYDTVFIGFPIWWYRAPAIISTFLESYDFAGKTLIPFATSGSSAIEGAEAALHALTGTGVTWKPGKLLNRTNKSALTSWLSTLK